MKRDEIRKAVNLLEGLSVDYDDRTAQEVEALDNAIDLVIMAAEAYERLGADNYAGQKAKELNETYVRGYMDGRKVKGEYDKGWADGCLFGLRMKEAETEKKEERGLTE